MPLITRNSQNANVKLGTTAQLAAITFTDGDLASDTTLNKLKIFDGSTLQNVGAASFSSSAVVSQSTTIADYTTPTAVVATSPSAATVEYLVIGGGGGGGGGANNPGGGGAGAYRTASGHTITSQTYTITVGNGGSSANGGDSIFDTITSSGGGKGATSALNAGNSANGSGGGGSEYNAAAGTGGAYGNNGGAGSTGGGGGGGAGGGGGGGGASGGNGGNGLSSSITGTSVTRAGGGGGSSTGVAGTGSGANTGSGGTFGNAGAAGIVIIKYLTSAISATGGTITINGSYTIHSFTSSGSLVITINGEPSNAKDDNTATKWTSNSETNPNIYVDMGSALNLCAAAFFFNSTDTTNTEILIQSSADASTWTTRRTITESNLTNGAYNYYRFNIAGGARYIRFYGNSAGSTVLSIWEIKILKKTDAEIFNDLGILTITASDTALGPDGT